MFSKRPNDIPDNPQPILWDRLQSFNDLIYKSFFAPYLRGLHNRPPSAYNITFLGSQTAKPGICPQSPSSLGLSSRTGVKRFLTPFSRLKMTYTVPGNPGNPKDLKVSDAGLQGILDFLAATVRPEAGKAAPKEFYDTTILDKLAK